VELWHAQVSWQWHSQCCSNDVTCLRPVIYHCLEWQWSTWHKLYTDCTWLTLEQSSQWYYATCPARYWHNMHLCDLWSNDGDLCKSYTVTVFVAAASITVILLLNFWLSCASHQCIHTPAHLESCQKPDSKNQTCNLHHSTWLRLCKSEISRDVLRTVYMFRL